MKLYVWPYKAGSRSGKALAEGLGAQRVRQVNSRFIPRRDKCVINWGNSGDFPFDPTGLGRVINHPRYVNAVANKKTFFQDMRSSALDEYLPPFAFNRQDATVLLSNMERPKIYCRTSLRGHSGDGIVIATTEDELVDAPLYTANLGWRREYRVHVAFRRAIDIQKKCRLTPENLEERGLTLDMDVRNLKGGWIYARERIEETEETLARMGDASLATIEIMGLHFGAVDVCVLKDGSVKVLEVNTACGLEGSTVDAYVNAFREELS